MAVKYYTAYILHSFSVSGLLNSSLIAIKISDSVFNVIKIKVLHSDALCNTYREVQTNTKSKIKVVMNKIMSNLIY